jgi:CBS domain-containing protein
MHDVVEFLRPLAPFEGLDSETLERLGKAAEIEYFPARTTILAQGEGPIEHVFVVRRGSVELVDRGRVLDLLGEGELVGHPSMLSGLPAGFEARAGEDALCYRLPAEIVAPLLARPAGMRYVARSLLARPRPGDGAGSWDLGPSQQSVGTLVSGEPVLCKPSATIREVAAAMADAGSSAALVRIGEGELGIITDHDLRNRVIAGDVPADAPVTEVMSAPAFTVGPERTAAEVALEMLDRGFRHVVVVSPLGDALGVLSDADLLASETQVPFALRRAIGEASSVAELTSVASRLPEQVVSLHAGGVAASQISGILTVVCDALTRRLIELAIGELGPPPCPLSWLALGSFGRRDAVPSSDVDSALVWDGDDADREARDYMAKLAARVTGGLGAAGLRPDAHGATAGKDIFDRSARSWRRLIRNCIDEPTENKGLIVLSLMLDARTIERVGAAQDVLDELRQLRHRRSLIRLMLRIALAKRPPTGFLRDFVVVASGEHRGQLDLKHGGMLPIGSIARWASLASGARTNSTRERLELAATAGILEPTDARTMTEAYELFWRLRLDHQVEQLRAGVEPDDFLDPKTLSPLTRTYLREAFGAVRQLQRSLQNTLRYA